MSTSRVICDLCGTEQEVESYGDYKCSNCGQEHCYDNDCYRIMLTEEQEEVLRQHRNGGIITIQAHRRSIFNTQKTDNSVQE